MSFRCQSGDGCSRRLCGEGLSLLEGDAAVARVVGHLWVFGWLGSPTVPGAAGGGSDRRLLRGESSFSTGRGGPR